MSDLRLGTLKAFNSGQYTATVELVGGRGGNLVEASSFAIARTVLTGHPAADSRQ